MRAVIRWTDRQAGAMYLPSTLERIFQPHMLVQSASDGNRFNCMRTAGSSSPPSLAQGHLQYQTSVGGIRDWTQAKET